MSWAPAARTATAVVKLGQQQQQHTAQQRQRQQQLQKHQLPHQEELAQPEKSQSHQHQQLRTQRPQRSFLSRASVRRASAQIQEIIGQRNRRPPNVCGRSVKNGSGDEVVSCKHVPSTSRSCNTNSSVSGEAAVKRGTQPGSAIVASQMFKTKLCIDHQTRGCTRGDSCPYAHSVEEMRNLPDLRKTKMCSLVLAGKGCKNRACKFAHSEEELRYTCTFSEFKTRICRFAQERGGRGCLYGVRCPYAHSPSELRPLEISTVPPTDDSNAEDKGNGDEEVVTRGQRPARSIPPPSSLHDLKGKHGLWGRQRELQLDHSAPQHQGDTRQRQKEQLKQQHQHQRWQKLQQQASPQQALQAQKPCQQQQQQDTHQQNKQPWMQPRQYQKPQQLRINQAGDGWTNVRSSWQPPQQPEDGGEEVRGGGPGEAAFSCRPDSRRRAPTDNAIQFAVQKDRHSLLGRKESHEKVESPAVAKLPRSLNKGTRATSAVVDALEAGGDSLGKFPFLTAPPQENVTLAAPVHASSGFNISEGSSQEGKSLNSAGRLQQKQQAHQREERQKHAEEPEFLQYEEAGNQHQSIAAIQHLQQHCWEQQAVEEVAESHTPPDLLPRQQTFVSVGEPSQHYLSITSSPPAAYPPRLPSSLTATGEERGIVGNARDLGSSYDDNGSDGFSDSRWDCKFGFAASTGHLSPRTGTDTPLNERDQSLLHHNSSTKRYNGPVAVLPPPGFEHVRIKPLSEFAYAATTPWVHASSTRDSSNTEECLLLHLHRQLLLHCQRQSDAHLLPSATMSRTTSTSNASTAVKMSSAPSYLDGVANSVWEDTLLTAPRSPNR